MDTTVKYCKQGQQFNRFGERIIDCRTGCGRSTTMLGTQLCDFCWEKGRKAIRDRAKQAERNGS